MPKNDLNVALKGLDDLFSSEETRQEEQREQVQQIPVSELFPFKNHPFKVLDDDAMTRTVESISQFGVLAPLIARPKPEGGYEIISGHRRKHAAELAHLDTVPVIVRNMEDDAATILMVDSNLQREHILPSERAFAYKMKLNAKKKQGARSDLTSTQVAQKLSVEKVGDDAGVSKDNLNLAKLPECMYEMRYIDSALLTPCAEYQRVLRTRKVAEISANFSEYVANEPKVSYRDGRYHVVDGQNTVEARIACNGGRDLPILCKVFHGLSKKDEALLFAVQTGISTDLTAGERLRADIVAKDEDACAFLEATEATGVTFALDGIRAEWKIYCIRSAYYIYKNYGSDIYQEALKIIVEAWWGDSDSFLSGILHGVTRFVAMYRDEYSRERLIMRLSSVHPKTITKNARKDTGNVADRHMKQILEIYNGSSRSLSLPVKR